MTTESPSQLVDLQRVRSCLSQICASQSEFDQFFTDVFQQLDALSSQLLRHQQAWQDRASLADAEYRRRSEVLARDQADLALREERLQKRTDQLQQAPEPPATSESVADDGRLHLALDEIDKQRAELSHALGETQKQAAELAQATTQLVETRHELQQFLASASATGPSGAWEAIQQQLLQVQQDRDSLQQERASLEAELEAVRNRAAEMSETLAQQKRETSQERVQWAEELKRLRRLLESLSAGQAMPARDPDAAATPAADVRPAPKTAPAESDPVLDSVMAQFELLQKDLARRRKPQATNPG